MGTLVLQGMGEGEAGVPSWRIKKSKTGLLKTRKMEKEIGVLVLRIRDEGTGAFMLGKRERMIGVPRCDDEGGELRDACEEYDGGRTRVIMRGMRQDKRVEDMRFGLERSVELNRGNRDRHRIGMRARAEPRPID